MLYGIEDFAAPVAPVAATGGVHFDGAVQGGGPTWLDIPSLTVTNNGLYSFSYGSRAYVIAPIIAAF